MYRATIIGASGAVGSALVRELLASDECSAVVALVRRPVPALEALPGAGKLRLHVIDMGQIEAETRARAVGCAAAFCTMGIGQPRKTTFEEFRRVDVEYTGAFARGAAVAGASHISLLSAVGADSASRNPYLRVKGDAEQAVVAAGMRRTSLFRPSLLVTRELRYGLQDRLSQALLPLLAPLLPGRFHQVHVEDLARAMRGNAEQVDAVGVEILHYPEFTRLLKAAGS
jgi:uncharacterized protein YbjT (DUF2867 family)